MSYAALYKGTTPIINLAAGSGGSTPWVRPAWPALSDLTSTDNVAEGIYGVDETDSNYVSVLVAVSTGTWSIDWGDGTVETGLTSNVKSDHLYDYASIIATPVDGLKPVKVIITTSGGNITTLSLQQKYTLTGLPTAAFRINWLDFSVNATSMTTLNVGGSTVTLHKLERCKIYGHNTTSMASMFANCFSLQSVPLFNTSAVTNMSSIFSGCYSLQSVPLFNTVSATNMSSMFASCFSLQSVPLFNTSAVTSMTSMFVNCYSLQSIPLFNTSQVTNTTSMFQGCYSLQSIPLINTVKVTLMVNMFLNCGSLRNIPLLNTSAVTQMTSMFQGCYSLQSIPLFNTSNVVYMSFMFSGCLSLKSIPLINTSKAIYIDRLFQSCTSLKTIPLLDISKATTLLGTFENNPSLTSVPLLDTSLVTNFGYCFSNCPSLQSIPVFNTSAATTAISMFTSGFSSNSSLSKGRTNGIRFSISYANCKLSATAINDIFTGLGIASGTQNITISGNHGAATCDQTIATAKGWTVVI